MNDGDDPLTRLGPNAGDGPPGSGRGQINQWDWGHDGGRRPGLPWIGIFLVVFGGLLLVQQVYPELEALGSVLVLAIGLAFLIKWVANRGTGSLYAGAIITALAVPGLVNAAGYEANGLSTFSFGIAFLFTAVVRLASGGGTGWQLWFGGLLALVGGVSITSPASGGLVVPILLVALGAALVLRNLGRGIRRR